jgi:hypothetical protein
MSFDSDEYACAQDKRTYSSVSPNTFCI